MKPMLVWYPQKRTRTVGLRLEPGWNAIPRRAAIALIERGVVLQEPPPSEAEPATEETNEPGGEDQW
jgi:hypothetical protein